MDETFRKAVRLETYKKFFRVQDPQDTTRRDPRRQVRSTKEDDAEAALTAQMKDVIKLVKSIEERLPSKSPLHPYQRPDRDNRYERLPPRPAPRTDQRLNVDVRNLMPAARAFPTGGN